MHRLLNTIRGLSPRWRVIAAMAACGLIGLGGAGCALRGTLQQDPAEAENPPPVVAQAVAPSDAVHAVIRPGLVVNVTVIVGGRNLIEEVGRRISENGTLTLPYLGMITLVDESLESLTSKLTAAYQEFYVNPQVRIEFVKDELPEGISPWGHVTVMGRVKRPGRVNIPPTRDLTVSVAIQQAGGFDTSAKETAIRVTRRGPDGETSSWNINLRAVGSRGRVDNDIVLEPEDVVYVPELFF